MQEAEMKRPYTYSRNQKPIVQGAIAGFVLATLFCMPHAVTAQGCHLFHSVAWLAFQLLRPAISAAWQTVPAHLCESSNFLQHFLQIVASIRTLLCVIAG
jgi:hypothetical protein